MAKLRAKLDRYVSVLSVLFRYCPNPHTDNNNKKKTLSNTKPITGHAHAHAHAQQQHSLCVCVCEGGGGESTQSIYDIYANYANAPRVPQCVCRDIVLTGQRDPWRRHTRRMRNICYSILFLDIKQTLSRLGYRQISCRK